MLIQPASENEVSILARVLGNEDGDLPADQARYILGITFSDRDRARMHELAVRNQQGELGEAEKEELLAFGKAGDLLAILKSRARRVLGVKRGLRWKVGAIAAEPGNDITQASLQSTAVRMIGTSDGS